MTWWCSNSELLAVPLALMFFAGLFLMVGNLIPPKGKMLRTDLVILGGTVLLIAINLGSILGRACHI